MVLYSSSVCSSDLFFCSIVCYVESLAALFCSRNRNVSVLPTTIPVRNTLVVDLLVHTVKLF